MQYRGIDITKINFTTRELMRQASATSKDRPFLIYVPREYEETFGSFEAQVNRISNLLKSEFNVAQGDKVCTMCDNIPELLHTIMAITNIGAIWVPINNMLVGESLRYIIDVSDAMYVIASSRFRDEVAKVLGNVNRKVQILPLEEISRKAKAKQTEYETPAKPDDISMIIYTSGTTGFPKGAVHTHNSYIRTGVRALEAIETTRDDRIHVYLPFFHGWAYLIMLGALYFKCSIIMEDRFRADSYWEVIEKFHITQDHWTGTVPLNLMKLPVSDFEQKVQFRIMGTFGALYDEMKQRWPNLRFQSLYGQTEHPCITEVPADQIFPGSDGVPKYPDEVLIMDDNGKALPAGEIGEIVCRCRCGVSMKGYYKNPEATAQTLMGHDLHSGDLGYLDERGHLHFTGRKKDALRVRGEMVSVEHIEHLLNQHPKIAESAIVGYRSPEKEKLKEDEIVAYIVLKKGEQLSTQEFHEWSEKNLARFMRPKYVVFNDSLPKTPTERIQRFKLRERGIEGAVTLF